MSIVSGYTETACAQSGHQEVADRLISLLSHKEYLKLESDLQKRSDTTSPEFALVTGVLANVQNQIAKSIRLLTPLLSAPSAKLKPQEERLGLSTLADDYDKTFRYGDAANTRTILLRRVGEFLSDGERDDIEDARDADDLLKLAPGETVGNFRPFVIPTEKNSAGMIEAPITVGNDTEPWILDTGANISLLIESRAQKLHLGLSKGTLPVAVFFGRTVPCHLAVIPVLRIGEAVVHNVPVLVMKDKDYYIPQIHLQLEAFLGYPVLSALGRISFYRDGHFGVDPPQETEPSYGSQMFMDGLTPVVAVKDHGKQRLFSLDTGAANTFLTARYLTAHRAEFKGQKLSTVEQPSGKLPAYYARRVTFSLGGLPITLHNVPVLAKPQGNGEDYFYGNLGQDVLKQFRSYTLDFRSMHFVAR